MKVVLKFWEARMGFALPVVLWLLLIQKQDLRNPRRPLYAHAPCLPCQATVLTPVYLQII